jgi:hypothetical protein
MLLRIPTVYQSNYERLVVSVNPPWFQKWLTFGGNQSYGTAVEVNLLELKLFDKLADLSLLPKAAVAGPFKTDGPAAVTRCLRN